MRRIFGKYRREERKAGVEEESSGPCVEWEVLRDLLLHRSETIPPLVLRFERFEKNIWKI